MLNLTSLKTKLIAGMVVLLIVAFGLSSVLLIKQKKEELSLDIYHSIKSFSDLTASQVVEFYERYLAEDSFVYFNREIQQLFDKTEEVTGIAVASYDGEILYDSSDEEARQYSGEARYVPDEYLERIQATYPSYALDNGRVIYLRTDVDGNVDFLDINEVDVDPIDLV